MRCTITIIVLFNSAYMESPGELVKAEILRPNGPQL